MQSAEPPLKSFHVRVSTKTQGTWAPWPWPCIFTSLGNQLPRKTTMSYGSSGERGPEPPATGVRRLTGEAVRC